jgi:hypothetical protein
MTTAAVSLTASSAIARPGALPGRIAEFLLVGGATLLLFPLAWAMRAGLGLDAAEYAVGFLMFHAAFVINDPHFAVTYLLFYKDARRRAFGDAFAPGQRARYLVAGLLVPLVLTGWAITAVSTGSPRTLGMLFELMFLLVGWHYVKQGFGVLTVLSARRGVHFTSGERAAVLVHCFAGWAHAWANPATGTKEVEEKGVIWMSLPHPAVFERITLVLFVASGVLLLAVFLHGWQTARRVPPLGPLVGLLVTVWLWTVYTSLDPLMMYMIPALHSVQYLYFVWLLKRNEAREEEGPPHFGLPWRLRIAMVAASSIVLGWVLLRGAPSFLDGARLVRAGKAAAATDLGATPWLGAFFAIVNIHHYFMDHVIWRRENPETRFLRG